MGCVNCTRTWARQSVKITWYGTTKGYYYCRLFGSSSVHFTSPLHDSFFVRYISYVTNVTLFSLIKQYSLICGAECWVSFVSIYLWVLQKYKNVEYASSDNEIQP